MCQDKFERRQIKMGSGVPTIPASTDHRNGDWIATDIYDGEFYMDTDTGLTYTRNGSIIQMSDGRKAQKTWKALITQTGTSAPVLTVVENSLGLTAVPAYVSAGTYTISGFAGNLVAPIEIHNGFVSASYDNVCAVAIFDVDTLFVQTSVIGVGASNGLLVDGCSITVNKY
jgi:hypothetical protein